MIVQALIANYIASLYLRHLKSKVKTLVEVLASISRSKLNVKEMQKRNKYILPILRQTKLCLNKQTKTASFIAFLKAW